ncbi:hypothetical protein ACFOG5_24600 [Pedobacter fastidiosus]|uniref:hypothetical protein n=1 Tax=Pedobacter fastidiosus TaxID=2765361 RepID=UPI00360A2EE3
MQLYFPNLTPAEMTTVLKKDLKLNSKVFSVPLRSSRNDGSFRKDLKLIVSKVSPFRFAPVEMTTTLKALRLGYALQLK